jgi:hypothetical protein
VKLVWLVAFNRSTAKLVFNRSVTRREDPGRVLARDPVLGQSREDQGDGIDWSLRSHSRRIA